jgi:hypothetical protein
MISSGAENPTSYFSAPSTDLDPNIFQGRELRDWVRKGIIQLLQDFLQQKYSQPEVWSHPWLAGSGVSYQWSAARQPGDLDCLVGIDFVAFRKANADFRGLSDNEISEELNDDFRQNLQPQTENWNGYELTFYVNPTATDIRSIKPYAAYDLKYGEWTVTPDPTQSAPSNADWDRIVSEDFTKTQQIHTRFSTAVQDVQESRSGANRRNAEVRLNAAAQQGEALYGEIHGNRSQAFSPTGEGYGDFNNYRWQAGKRLGTIDKLRNIRKYTSNMTKSTQAATYGVELPDVNTLIRRAALQGRK